MATTVAIDWSGARNPRGKIWLALAHDGELAELKLSRSRNDAIYWLLQQLEKYPSAVAGIDFAFSMPRRFVESHGLSSAIEFWKVVERFGENWLRECGHPFWGRRNSRMPNKDECEPFRRTERDIAETYPRVTPKSVFQIGGGGQVGTGSIRGMPFLTKVHEAGIAVWPFVDPRAGEPMVVEIYPRLFTGEVAKANRSDRCKYLDDNFPNLRTDHRAKAMDSDDAFDAAISAIKLTETANRPRQLLEIDEVSRIEGEIWRNASASNRISPEHGPIRNGRNRMAVTTTIGELESVPIRDVWPDEAQNLTPWLADNVGVLANALGMDDLELAGSEVSVGPFSADLVLDDSNSGKVVVENMIGKTDHDHLGKLITYAAGLDASHAVLITEAFRDEHRSALQWLNANCRNSVSFFGIELKVWKIGGSSPAPQFDIVVQPDEWVRRVRAANSGELSPTQLAYLDFWAEFLAEFRRRYPGWSRAKAAPRKEINLPSGKSDFRYHCDFCGPNQSRFRLQLYVDAVDHSEAARRYSQLENKQSEIEQTYGEPLAWEPLRERKASRIAAYYPKEVNVHTRGNWDELRRWALERLGPFREAMQPHIDKVL